MYIEKEIKDRLDVVNDMIDMLFNKKEKNIYDISKIVTLMGERNKLEDIDRSFKNGIKLLSAKN